MHRKHLPVLAAAVAVALAACGSPSAAGSAAGCAGQTIKIGQSTAHSVQYAPAYIAEKQGFFAKRGLTVETAEMGGGPEALQALTGGSLDLVATGFTGALSAVHGGAPIVAIASASNRVTTDIGMKAALAPPEGTPLNATLEVLRGKRIGVTSAGAPSDQILRFLLKKAGLDPEKDVQIIATGGAAATTAAFSTGTVDAYIVGPPASYLAAEKGDGKVVLKLGTGVAPDLDGMTYGAIVAGTRSLEAKKALIQCYVDAYDDALTFINADPRKAGEVLRPDFPEMTDQQYDLTWQATAPAFPKTSAMVDAEARKAADFYAFLTGDTVEVAKAYSTAFSKDHP